MQVEIICVQWFTREMVSTSRNTWTILVIPLSNEKYISKTSFLYRGRITFCACKTLISTALCVAASQTEIELLADKIVLMSVTYRKACVCLQGAFCLCLCFGQKGEKLKWRKENWSFASCKEKKVLQNFASKGAKHSLLNEDFTCFNSLWFFCGMERSLCIYLSYEKINCLINF